MLMVFGIQNNFVFVPPCDSALIEEWYLSRLQTRDFFFLTVRLSSDRVHSVCQIKEGNSWGVLTGHVGRRRKEESMRFTL